MSHQVSPELLRAVVGRIKAMSGLRVPAYEQPADSFVEQAATEIVAIVCTELDADLAALRDACRPLVAVYAQEVNATDGAHFERGLSISKAQVRAIQELLPESPWPKPLEKAR